MDKIITFSNLHRIKAEHPGKTIVHSHGVYDLFHIGHLKHFQSAKALGDILVVTLTPDRYVNKGPGRPHFTEHQRLEILASLNIVDYVCLNEHPRATPAILELKPNYYVKGPDYRCMQDDITGGIFEEAEAVRSVGGEIAFTDDETKSSTELINRYFANWDEEQKTSIDLVRNAGGLEKAIAAIERFENKKVLVVGEPIIDTYVFCEIAGISSKSPTVSARYKFQEDYAGGSLAIANHLASLGCQVTLLLTHGGENYFLNVVDSFLDQRVERQFIHIDGSVTPRKTRYLTPFQSQRIFELINIQSNQWASHNSNGFIDKLSKLSNTHDLTIVADFGHGLFEGSALSAVSDLKGFVAVNVQTNSDNFGFNPFTKHKNFSYLSIDERECRVALQDRITPIETLIQRTRELLPHTPFSVTLGTRGSRYFSKDQSVVGCPVFFKDVIDTTGAGDAYFAITSLLVEDHETAQLIPFLGNCFAGLKTRIIGNKHAVSKTDLIRTISAILK